MDFGSLLHTAQRNEKGGKKDVRYYSTKFEPPKKEQRNKQQLSDNIKKFLARKEAEEKAKKMVLNRKKEELLALRAQDKKATRRVSVMLKRTKSANQSVLQEAVDSNNTSVTLAGPMQPDEDDYGYVSQEASAFYNKMMEKYSQMPEEPKFSLKKKKVSTDLNSTKERVRAALEREKEEASMPHRRKRKLNDGVSAAAAAAEPAEIPRQETVKPKKALAPPPLNFNDLLKLAEKKQFEPIVIEQKPKEDEKLFTKKQRKEMEREKEWRDRKEGRLPVLDAGLSKIPKVNEEKSQKTNGDLKSVRPDPFKKPLNIKDPVKKIQNVGKIQEVAKKPILGNKPVEKKPVPLQNQNQKLSNAKVTSLNKPRDLVDLKKKEIGNLPNKNIPQKKIPDVKSKLPSSELKQLPPRDPKPRQFPPSDVTRFPPKDVKRKAILNKRRILDDEEYDSEMDDFIDDGPEESEDYSKYISEIFGYDKSKYRNAEDDIDNMESTFAQQMREEVISTKIGIMEDLEDMKQEEEDKRRKAMRKKGKL